MWLNVWLPQYFNCEHGSSAMVQCCAEEARSQSTRMPVLTLLAYTLTQTHVPGPWQDEEREEKGM